MYIYKYFQKSTNTYDTMLRTQGKHSWVSIMGWYVFKKYPSAYLHSSHILINELVMTAHTQAHKHTAYVCRLLGDQYFEYPNQHISPPPTKVIVLLL